MSNDRRTIGGGTRTVNAGWGAIVATGTSASASICWPWVQCDSQTFALARLAFPAQSDGIASATGVATIATGGDGEKAIVQACAAVTN
ncbi:MAG: hypothetical protein E6H48_05105 [Betaproteobacteria bacterium]|nr:MAG: hypothetical protein E6H48_05105 [Betaproteobacteria bacterium]